MANGIDRINHRKDYEPPMPRKIVGKLTVVLDPEQRRSYLEQMLAMEGLHGIVEDEHAAYCPISLTSTPEEAKQALQERQDMLMKNVLAPEGITAYDPSSAPFSPDKGLSTQPNVIYAVDSGKIASARFFVGYNILPSTGFGSEYEKAKTLNRIGVILLDENIRVTRMQPHRLIYLSIEHGFAGDIRSLRQVFRMLQQYDPGVGFNGSVPVLLGFDKQSQDMVDLEEAVYQNFPHLQYQFDGTKPILQLKITNPELLYPGRQV